MKLVVHSLLLGLFTLLQTCAQFRVTSDRNLNQKKGFCDCRDRKGNVECPGKTYCEAWQWISCECDATQCVGECSSESKDGYKLTADVLHRITGDSLTKAVLIEKKRTYLPILNDLLGNNVEGIYTIKYEDRTIRFSFSENAINLLKETRYKLEFA